MTMPTAEAPLEFQLKGGYRTTDRRLDRIPQFEPKSLDYPVTATITATKLRGYSWRPGENTDQGREGACGGHGWTQELMARPRKIVVPNPDQYAYALYKEMQRNDRWPGEDYEGTSVIAGATVLRARGAITEYRWAFGLQDLLLALGYKGPAVLGIPWYDSMYRAPGGTVKVSGQVVGGHCLLAYGVSVKNRTVLLRNSWGPDWGIGGNAAISWDDLERLLHENGEACIPIKATKYAPKYALAA